MNVQEQLLEKVVVLLSATLGLRTGAIPALPETRLFGAIPELDSMSVMTFLISLEEQYDITIADDEVDAAMFETLGSVVDFLRAKIG